MSNFPLRIDPELKKQLQILAKEKKRSLNNLIEVILTSHVDSTQDKNSKELSNNG